MGDAQINVVTANSYDKIGIKGRVQIDYRDNKNVCIYTGDFKYYDNYIVEATYDNMGNQISSDDGRGNYMLLNEKAKAAFMEIVRGGKDKSALELDDLYNLDLIAEKYNIKVDKSQLADGEVKLTFRDGKTLNIDFITDAEIKKYVDMTTSPVEKAGQTLYKYGKKCYDAISPYAKKCYDALSPYVNKYLEKVAEKIDTATERYEQWRKFN